jgi:hypothetical protein
MVKRAWNDPTWTPPDKGRQREPVSEVRLMPEYTVELPLWGCEWWHLGLDPRLLDDLADWQAYFDQHFDHMHGWNEASARDEWAAQATHLTDRLRKALPVDVELGVDLWPLLADPPGPSDS